MMVVLTNQRMEFRNGTEALGSYCRFLDRAVIYLKYRI